MSTGNRVNGADDGSTRRIAEVAAETGLTRELIHHYLRQGLLPPPPERAQYSRQQIRLLHQIRRLREDHHLPLELIRQVFELFDFDPERLEALTLADSPGRRMSRLAGGGAIFSSELLMASELTARAGITSARLAQYTDARLVEPLGSNGEEHFTRYDANLIAQCEHAAALGVDFEVFRTIGGYVRVAFDLENRVLFDVPLGADRSTEQVVGDIFLRTELVNGFIQNLLQSLIARRVSVGLTPPATAEAPLDLVVYRPSEGFVRRHHIDRAIATTQDAVGRAAAQRLVWRDAAELLRHAGRYREAVFFLEQAVERWPQDRPLRIALGQALLLAGEQERAAALLAPEADAPVDPVSSLLLALGRFLRGGPTVTEAGQAGAELRQVVDRALAVAPDDPGARLDVRLLGGWLLTALPPAFADADRGLALLGELYAELQSAPPTPDDLPGRAERHRINVAYLLLEARTRLDRPNDGAPADEALRALVCRLDPGCVMAQAAFLSEESNA